MNKKILYLSIIVLILLTISSKYIFDTFSMSVPIRNINIYSENSNYNNNESGSFKINKEAYWIDSNKARININIDTKVMTSSDKDRDILLVLDTSDSMYGEKLDIVKNSTIDLVNNILSNTNNRVGLITYNTTSTIVSNLTNDIESITNNINNLSTIGATNYYSAYNNIDNILKSYIEEDNRDLIIIFLADGNPNLMSPLEKGEYKYLKNSYPNIIINAIQYEMGESLSDYIKDISDNQFIADRSNISIELEKASSIPKIYTKFIIEDYINTEYFTIDNITTTTGTTNTDNNKITWDISNNIKSGDKITLSIDINLKSEYHNIGGLYPTNTKTNVVTKLDTIKENITTNNSPLISDIYVVKYDTNTPEGCNIENPENTKEFVFTNVEINNDKLVCEGYQFKGYEIITDKVNQINDDYFIMPESDVELKGVWSKLTIAKSVDGTVSKVQTLYSIMEEQAVPDNISSTYVKSSTGIDFSKNSSDTNGKGVYEIASTSNNEYPIYYYRGAVTNNNILFADTCFKAVISTETGGVKLIYNGIPTDGKCNNTGTASHIGTKRYNSYQGSPGSVGYMYGTRYNLSTKSIGVDNWYEYIGKTLNRKWLVSFKNSMSSTMYYYGNSIRWDTETNKYYLTNIDESEVKQIEWSASKLKGYYTCFSNTNTSCNTIYYISGGDNTRAYYVTLSSSNNISNYLNVSKEIIYDEETGRYTLNNPTNAIDWYTNHSNYKGYYICSDLNSKSCNTIFYIYSTNNGEAFYVQMSNGDTYGSDYEKSKLTNWKFGNSFIYNEEEKTYTLNNTLEFKPMEWSINYNTLNNNHYTCFNTDGKCKNIYYIYYTVSTMPYSARYITISDGKSVEDAISEMFDINPNQYSTEIKGDKNTSSTVDWWYYNNIELKDYSKYIEDTIYCNDRSIYSLGGWNPNGGSTSEFLYFGFYGRSSTPTVICPKDIDKFTVSDTLGNGALDYPTGLLTVDEIKFAGISTGYLRNGTNWWTMTPSRYQIYTADQTYMATDGRISEIYVQYAGTVVRPVISLKPGTRVDGGDGTGNDPYTIEEIIE